MTEIIDLSLLRDSRALLDKLLERHGLTYFLAREGKPLFALDKSKVELVVRTTQAKLARRGITPHPKALEHCRKEIRRELLRQITSAMMRVGY